MTRYAILGHPIAHSLSPVIHGAAFAALGLEAEYEAIDVEPDDLKSRLEEMKQTGYHGFNVTIPHKEAILPLLDRMDPDAEIIGAVNTVIRENNAWAGLNTDMTGFVKCIQPVLDRISGSDVLVLGAGGAARAVLQGLLKAAAPASITVLNRTLDRAEALAAHFEQSGGSPRVLAEPLFQDDLQGLVDRSGVIINTTSVGMKPYTDASPLEEIKFKKKPLLIDLIYTPAETTLMKSVRNAGGTALGGLEMLLHQAAAAFLKWTGKEMPPEPVRQAVEEALAQRP